MEGEERHSGTGTGSFIVLDPETTSWLVVTGWLDTHFFRCRTGGINSGRAKKKPILIFDTLILYVTDISG